MSIRDALKILIPFYAIIFGMLVFGSIAFLAACRFGALFRIQSDVYSVLLWSMVFAVVVFVAACWIFCCFR